MDSWLGSFIPDHPWKWIYNLPRLQQTKSPHQNQRIYCFTCSSGFLCWFEPYSFSVRMRHYKHLRLALLLVLVGEFYKVVVWSHVCCELMRLSRFIAIVHPLKYITLMTRRRTFQVIFFSWVLTVSYNMLTFMLYIFYFKTTPVPFI